VNYDRKLTRPLALEDGTTLVTLLDAAKIIETAFVGVLKDAALEHAIELLMQAAKSGKRKDVAAATRQMEIVLRAKRLME
jgi:hypothetical protein